MARKSRLRVPDDRYHIILHGNAHQDEFLTPGDRPAYCILLNEISLDFGD